MAVQISSYRPRMRLDNPASVYFPAQTVGGSSISESFTVPPPVSQRPQGPALVPGVAPPSKSGSVNASSGATGPPGSFDGRRMRSKSTSRRTVDYNASLINYVQNRIWQRDFRDMRALQPDASYNHLTVPPVMMLHKPVNCITTRCVRTATNKLKCPIFSTCWTPEGRRLVTGASSGEFTLWHGLTFSFETILQAHDSAVRTMIWSHNDLWMLTADHSGFVKYWQSNMNNVKMFQAHRDPVRGLSFCPTDQKFASCSDDGTVRIWDFVRCYEEKILRGHGSDVKCVDWHPHKSLVASGSKDTQQPVKLWDPRTGASLATIHAHKHTVMDVKWNRNGNWLLTASRDHFIKLFDVRSMKDEVISFRGHKKEATTLAWHPIHECLFASGGSDGAIMYWMSNNEKELGSVDEAHDTMVWSLSWHPLGHILVSGSNDHTTKFWTRNRLGDAMRDRYNLNTMPFGVSDDTFDDIDQAAWTAVPGLEAGQNDQNKKQQDSTNATMSEDSEALVEAAIPGLDFSDDKTGNVVDVGAFLPDTKSVIIRRKPIYTKPVPRAFERAWAEGRETSAVKSNSHSSRPQENSTGLLGESPDDSAYLSRLYKAMKPELRWPGGGGQRPLGSGFPGPRGPPDQPGGRFPGPRGPPDQSGGLPGPRGPPDQPGGGFPGPRGPSEHPGTFPGPRGPPDQPGGGFPGPRGPLEPPGSFSGPRGQPDQPGGGFPGPRGHSEQPGSFPGPRGPPDQPGGGFSGPRGPSEQPGSFQGPRGPPDQPGGGFQGQRGPPDQSIRPLLPRPRMSQMPPRGRGGSVRLSGPRPLLPLPPDSDQHPPEPDEWHPHPAGEWQEGVGFDKNDDRPPHGDFNYHEDHPPFRPFNPPHEDERQFPPWRRRPPGPDVYPDERDPGPEMERFGPPGPEMEHYGPSDPDVERFKQPQPMDDGATGLPCLLDIKVPPPGAKKRGPEHMDGDFYGGELPVHPFGPPSEKMPQNFGPGNDMWSGENPPPPPMGPGRGAPPFRGGPGRRAPRGRGMRGVRGR